MTRTVFVAIGCAILSACATTARMHSVDELNLAGARCGLALGELIQDEEEKRLVIMVRAEPTAAERACVTRWAKRNGLRPVFIDSIAMPEG